jgi:hypothetical protein
VLHYRGGEDPERVSAAHYGPALASVCDDDGDDGCVGSDEGSEHQRCGGSQG